MGMSVYRILLLLFVSCPSFTWAKTISVSDLPESSVAFWFESGGQFRSKDLMIPASLSKIPTALAVLERLGLDHHFHTQFLSSGAVKNGVLKGDLYLKGGGDPSFVSEDLWKMINELKRFSIERIEGNLYVDDFYFDDVRFSESRRKKRVDRAYDAPVGAMSFNWNSLSIYVRPTETGKPGKVFLDPHPSYVVVKNETTTGQRTQISIQKSFLEGSQQEQLVVKGSISKGTREKTIYKNITHPGLWSGSSARLFLKQQGITVTGKVERKQVPENSAVLVDYKSKPLRQIVADMMKFSNNYVAEMLTKHLDRNSPKTLPSSLIEIRKWIREQLGARANFRFQNPSGLTRANQLTAEQIGQLLVKAKSRFEGSEFMSSLPLAGMDGTLRKRLKSFKGEVRAKTGYLAGVIGLAGYVQSPQGQPQAFVMMYNGPRKSEEKARAFFRQLLAQSQSKK